MSSPAPDANVPCDSEERLRAIVESAPNATILVRSDGEIVLVNAECERLFGYSRAELLGRCAEILVPERFRGAHPGLRAAFLESPRPRAIGEGRDVYCLRKNGTEVAVEIGLTPISTEDATYVIAAVVDITERKRLETQFQQAQKMEAVGRLAGGVAHDFNNLLTVIGGYAELLRFTSSCDAAGRAHLDQITGAVERATALTKQLLAFSRHERVEPVALNLDDVIARTGGMLQRIIGEDVALEIVPSPALGSVKADRGQIEQVLMNLAVNARDAMAAGGTITIRTGDVPWETFTGIAEHGMRAGPYVVVSVADTGTGMPPEILARMFEPFFTTKARGKGTGLGLATVHGIVRQAQGCVRVESAVGRGTRVAVYVPRVDETPAPLRPAAVRPAAARGTETVLVAEDDPSVRSLVRRILEAQGYSVITAPDGGAAATEMERRGSSVDLLVTDIVMPRLSGSDLLDRVRATRPDLRVLVLTGYADRDSSSRIEFGPRTALVRKPFSADVLLRRVRDVLDARPAVSRSVGPADAVIGLDAPTLRAQ